MAFVFAVILMILLGLKLNNIEHSSSSFEVLFGETRDKIKALSV